MLDLCICIPSHMHIHTSHAKVMKFFIEPMCWEQKRAIKTLFDAKFLRIEEISL